MGPAELLELGRVDDGGKRFDICLARERSVGAGRGLPVSPHAAHVTSLNHTQKERASAQSAVSRCDQQQRSVDCTGVPAWREPERNGADIIEINAVAREPNLMTRRSLALSLVISYSLCLEVLVSITKLLDMRRIAAKQDVVRYPLNEVLGRETHIRILRTLVLAASPLSAADLTKRCRVSAPGMHQALARLLATGAIVRISGGRAQQYTMRKDGMLADGLETLFALERRRYAKLMDDLKHLFRKVAPPPRSAWLQGGVTEVGVPLEIHVLHDSREVDQYLRSLRHELYAIEHDYDVTIEIIGYTQADMPDVADEDVVLLAGVPFSTDDSPAREPASHQSLDRRARGRSAALANLLHADPSILGRAQWHLERLLARDQSSARGDLEEWSQILASYSFPRLLNFLTSTSPRAERLRQSSPFWAVLTELEKQRIQSEDEQ